MIVINKQLLASKWIHHIISNQHLPHALTPGSSSVRDSFRVKVFSAAAERGRAAVYIHTNRRSEL